MINVAPASSSPSAGAASVATLIESHASVSDTDMLGLGSTAVSFPQRGLSRSLGLFGSGHLATPPGCGTEALRRNLLSFHARHANSLSDLILILDDGQAVLANRAIVEVRLSALIAAFEPIGEKDPLVDDDRVGQGSVDVQHQVRLPGLSRRTLGVLLQWAYGEVVPSVGAESISSSLDESPALSLEDSFDVLVACDTYRIERLSALLRDAVLEALDVEHFAVVLRESHLRHLTCLKQGCMRFALHHFDELVERPEVFINELQELPEVVTELFRLGRRWKDEILDSTDDRPQGGRKKALRYAPAAPSTFVADLERLFNVARLEEQRKNAKECGSLEDRHEFAPDCQVAVGGDIYLGHAAVLAARSDFFLAAFTSDMVERETLLVTLQHVRGDAPRRGSVLALLYFLYTGKTSKIDGNNAMEVLALLGSDGRDEATPRSGSDDVRAFAVHHGGFLQLHDDDALRSACEGAAERAALCDDDACLPLLVQAHGLGASRLKASAMRLAVHHFKDLAARGAFECLPSSLLTEVLQHVAAEYDQLLPSAARGLKWELSMLPAPDDRLDNTFEAVSSADLSCGAGACGSAGCSEASLVATFDRLVRVRRIRIGVDLTSGDFDASRLNGSRFQFLATSGMWQDAGVSVSVEDGVVREIELPKILVAKAFRLVRRQRLAVGLFAFE
eukprot:TRINITY_DN37209_c2_g1_i1.p1 TRINITY_DN37209_c2_g1~~TRINITY_DN37209_c2_g1_i1.p1  ORF type:complete len:677 (+),score=129.70 TRINITY_DN37209_c2_g1_i1:304-2334(+)